jgi:hypothetical protein
MPKKSTTETTARESPTRNENLKIAHDLAKLDLPIFPCKPDKSPHTKTGFKAATTDKKQIDRWWDKHPDALPGLLACRVLVVEAEPTDMAERFLHGTFFVQGHEAQQDVFVGQVHRPTICIGEGGVDLVV